MRTARQLVWFYVRPTLHDALAARAEARGCELEVEVIDILEKAVGLRRSIRRRHLRLLPSAMTSETLTPSYDDVS